MNFLKILFRIFPSFRAPLSVISTGGRSPKRRNLPERTDPSTSFRMTASGGICLLNSRCQAHIVVHRESPSLRRARFIHWGSAVFVKDQSDRVLGKIFIFYCHLFTCHSFTKTNPAACGIGFCICSEILRILHIVCVYDICPLKVYITFYT